MTVDHDDCLVNDCTLLPVCWQKQKKKIAMSHYLQFASLNALGRSQYIIMVTVLKHCDISVLLLLLHPLHFYSMWVQLFRHVNSCISESASLSVFWPDTKLCWWQSVALKVMTRAWFINKCHFHQAVIQVVCQLEIVYILSYHWLALHLSQTLS